MSDNARSRPSSFTRAFPPPAESFRDLGPAKLAKRHELTDHRTYGHWCSRCEGIWFGYALEVECPVCGNRKG